MQHPYLPTKMWLAGQGSSMGEGRFPSKRNDDDPMTARKKVIVSWYLTESNKHAARLVEINLQVLEY
jgi:hypothetical protein